MTEDRNREKIVGYITIILSVLIIGAAIVMTVNYYIAPKSYITVYFPKIGQLKHEQPLFYNGIAVGEIVNFDENVYSGVAVKIRLFRNLEIREGYQFYSEDIDLFGYSRRITFINGPKAEKRVAESANLFGSYYLGLPEIIASIDKLNSMINILRENVTLYLDGDTTAMRLVSLFDRVNDNQDEIIESLEKFSRGVTSSVNGFVDNLDSTITLSSRLEKSSRKLIVEDIDKLANFVNDAQKLSKNVELKVSDIRESVNGFEEALDTNIITEILNHLDTLQGKLKDISKDEHKLRIIVKKYD